MTAGAVKRVNARQVALDTIALVESGAPINEALSRVKGLSSADRALVTQLVYGVERQRRFLDAWIGQLRQGPVEPKIRNILRLALFQLHFLDRIPDYAIFHEAVEAAKRVNPRAAPMVNAVLRRAQRQPPTALSTGEAYSHPDWLVDRWRSRYGDYVIDILRRDNEIPPLTLRVDIARTSRETILDELRDRGLEAEPSPYVPEAIRVKGALWLEDFPPFQSGLVMVQDESSMLVAWALDPKPGQTVLDMAVGLGGKALHVLERTQGRLCLTAVDLSSERLARFQSVLRERGFDAEVRVEVGDASRLLVHETERYDRVLLDAPCSGLGVLRRRVDARWKKKPEDLMPLQSMQKRLLAAGLRVLKPGGVLVYSTCSVEPEETWAVIDEAPRWGGRRDSVIPFLPHPALNEWVSAGVLALPPGALGMDGFFIARLVKPEAGEMGDNNVHVSTD